MYNNIEIVRTIKDHIDDIVLIEHLSFSMPWSRESITEEITTNKFARYVTALVDGKVAGYAGMWSVCGEGHITNIAVHPDYRGNGVGDALLRGIISIAEDEGITAITLEVRRSNYIAQSLYKKYGFEPAGVRKNYYADNNEDAIIMWKIIRE